MSRQATNKKAKPNGSDENDAMTDDQSRLVQLHINPQNLPVVLSNPPQPSDFALDPSVVGLAYDDPQIVNVLESLHEFMAQRYSSAKSATNPCDVCWHQRLKDELSLGLQCCEYFYSEQDQQLGSEVFDLIQLYHAVSPTFVKDCHASSDLCNSTKQPRRTIESLNFDFQQRCVMAQMALQWLKYFLHLVQTKAGPEVRTGLDILLTQYFYATASHEYALHKDIVKWADYLPDGLKSFQAKHCQNSDEMGDNDTTQEQNQLQQPPLVPEQYKMVPLIRHVQLSTQEVLPEFLNQLHAKVTSYEASINNPSSVLVNAWLELPSQFRVPVMFSPIPQNDFFRMQYLIRKSFECENLCQHESLRRELIMCLAMEESLGTHTENDSVKIKLSTLWDGLIIKDSFCTKKCKSSVATEDQFLLNEQAFLQSLVANIPLNERLTAYRQAQHTVYAIQFNTVPQAEMIQWLWGGIKRRQTYDSLLTLAAKAAGPYPPMIANAIRDQPLPPHLQWMPQINDNDQPLVFASGSMPEIPDTLAPSGESIHVAPTTTDSKKKSSKTGGVITNEVQDKRKRAGADGKGTELISDTKIPNFESPLLPKDGQYDYFNRHQGSGGAGAKGKKGTGNTKGPVAISDQNEPYSHTNPRDILLMSVLNKTLGNNSVEEDNFFANRVKDDPNSTQPNPAKRKTNPNLVSTVPTTSLTLKSGGATIPLAILNTKQHIIAPNKLDLGTSTSLATYLNGLTAVAGKYRKINPLDEIDQVLSYPTPQEASDVPIAQPQTARRMIKQLELHHDHLSSMDETVVHILKHQDRTANDMNMMRDIILTLTKTVVDLKEEIKELKGKNEGKQ